MNLLKKLFQRPAIKQEIDDELRFHIEQRTAENIANGMTPEEAAREARKRFGNVQSVREECRETRGASFGETTLNDIRFGARLLRKNPGFTTIAVLTLALGIGATSSVFSLVRGVLLTPPPYATPERIVLVSPTRLDKQPYPRGCSSDQWTEWQRDAQSFEGMAGYHWGLNFLVLPDGSEFVAGLSVTPDYFRVLGIHPELGRTFTASEASGRPLSALIISHELWKRRFNGESNIIGRTIQLGVDKKEVTVVGVMPPDIRFLPSPQYANEPNYNPDAQVEYWTPDSPDPAKSRETSWNVVGRLRDGVTLTQAQAELTAIAARQAKDDRDLDGITANAELLTTSINREAQRLLLPLAGAVGFVFVIACVNVAGLLLARSFRRQPEYAVRCALGAGRGQVFRQALTESLLLAMLGGVLGAAFAATTVKVLKAIAGGAIPRLDAVRVDWPMLLFCFGAAVTAAMIAGLVPALRSARVDLASTMNAGGTRSSASISDRRILAGMAMVQVALTLTLLVGAGLLIRTTFNLARAPLGYSTQNILAMSITQLQTASDVVVDFHRRALQRVAELPGVESAAYAWGVPLTGNKWVGEIAIKGELTHVTYKDLVPVAMRCVTPEYFDTVGLHILAGRNFRSMEAFSYPPLFRTNIPNVAIINQAMAERYFPDTGPIGKTFRFTFGGNWAGPQTAEIVGIAANSRTEAITQAAEPEVFFSFWQVPPFVKDLVVRTATDPRAFVAIIQRELRAIDPTVVIENVKTFEQLRSDSIAARLFAMRLLVGFSAVAGVLAVVGVYGVLSLSVGSRRREIAIRMAVGAQRRDVLRLFLGEGLKLIAVGLVVGTGLAIALARLLGTFLYEVEPTDPLTIVVVAILFAAVALLACYIPARRAAKTDPMTALRYE
jgi:putative ABC transport system permease protein